MRRMAIVLVVAVLLAGCAWARPRFDGARTAHNPIEVGISRENVATLTESFRVFTANVDPPPAFVVAHGHLYVQGSPTQVFDSAGGPSCSGSPRTCPAQWSVPESSPPEVVGDTLYSASAAYDADGVRGCSGAPKVCEPLWMDRDAGSQTATVDLATLHFGFGGNGNAHGAETVVLNGFRNPKPASCTAPAGQLPSCSVAWTRVVGSGSSGGIVGQPAIADGRLFTSYSAVGAPHGTLMAFDGSVTTTNASLWTAVLPGVGSPDIAVADGIVVTTAQTPTGKVVVAYDAAGVKNCSGTPTVCTPLWVSDPWTGAGFDAAPALANGVLYRAVGDQLRAYDLHGVKGCSGTPVVCQKLWVGAVGPGVTAPAVANNVVYTSASDGTVQAYDAQGVTGCSATTRVCGPLWQTNLGSVAGPVEVSGGRIYVGTGTATGFGADSVRVFAPS
jgi:hypothetical protein